MSDEIDPVSSEQSEEQKQDSKTVETNNQGPSDKPFHKKVEEFQNGEREEHPWEDVTKWKVYGGIIGGLLSILLSISLSLSGHPGWGAIFLFLPVIMPLALSESARVLMNELIENVQEEMEDGNQSLQKSTQSKPKRICSDCGWQNPQENSFCHDCGSKLGKSG